MKNIQSHKEKLFNKISIFLRHENRSKILTGIFISIIASLILFFALTTLELLNYFSSLVRSILFFLTIIFFVILIFVFTFKPIKKYLQANTFSGIKSAAQQLGYRFPQIKDNLLNSLQLLENNRDSDDLTNAAFENVYSRVFDLNFLETIDYSKLKKYLIFLIVFIISFTAIFTSITSVGDAALRIINFDKEFAKPIPFTLDVLSKNIIIKRDEAVTLVVKASGEIPHSINIITKTSNQSEVKNHNVKVDSNNIFKLHIRNIKNPIKYFAQHEDFVTETFLIDVTSAPIINLLNFDVIPPKYSGISTTTQENNGNIRSLKGTKVKYSLSSSKVLLKAKRLTNLGIEDSLNINDKKAAGNFTLIKNDKYHFEITDKDKNKNENPIEFSLEIIPDLFPEIEISHPEQVSLIPSNDIISINYKIKDDFGFSKSRLKFLNNKENEDEHSQIFTKIDLSISKSEIEQSLYFNWDVSRLGFKESDEISYFIEVFDNDMVSGPKSTKSKVYTLRVPTLNELFAQAENVQNKAVEDLTETLKEAEELRKELNQIKDELKQDDKEIDWNEKKRIEETAKKFEKISNKIEEVQEQLQKMQKQMSENNLLSEETMEKYNELQDLMDELNSEEMRKAMEDMQKSLQQLMRDKVQKSLDNLVMNEEMFQKSIERTMNLLKKIQIEQKMDEVIKRTEEMVENLDELSKSTENSLDDENKSDELANDQKNIENNLNSLEEELQNLEDKMSEVSDMPNEKMEELSKKFAEQQNQKLSQEAMEQLQKQNSMDALKKQEQLSQNMSSMKDQLQQMQQQMQQQSQQMVMQNMMKAIDNIIGLSKEQESLTEKTQQARSNPNELPKIANQQMEIKQNLDNILKQLSSLSQKSFAITPEMGEALGKAQNNMMQSIAGIQSRNGRQSSSNQGKAMSNLNQAAALLQNSLKNMMQGGGQGSGGMMSMMQQLQQMGQQQMGLNKMTQMMQQGQLSMQQQAQLQKLSKEQGVIQKSLSELNKEAKEAGQSKKLGANLDQILEEMNEVISGLNTQKVDDKLIKSQEKILSKLLDAQRSINERDFEKNRESFSGKQFNLESPSQLNLTEEQAKDLLREELLKSVKEGYSKDYENLIRRYFENLNNSSSN